jgi:hypothetical protein
MKRLFSILMMLLTMLITPSVALGFSDTEKQKPDKNELSITQYNPEFICVDSPTLNHFIGSVEIIYTEQPDPVKDSYTFEYKGITDVGKRTKKGYNEITLIDRNKHSFIKL